MTVLAKVVAGGALGAFAADYSFTSKPPNGPLAPIY